MIYAQAATNVPIYPSMNISKLKSVTYKIRMVISNILSHDFKNKFILDVLFKILPTKSIVTKTSKITSIIITHHDEYITINTRLIKQRRIAAM